MMELFNYEIILFFIIIIVGFVLMYKWDRYQRKQEKKYFEEIEQLMEESERKFNESLDKQFEEKKQSKSKKN